MKSRSWPRRSGIACAVSLLCGLLAAQPAPKGVPAFALLDESDAAQWRSWASGAGWRVVTPGALPADATADARVQALATAVQEAAGKAEIDPARVYVAGRGASAALAFYAVSRLPDAWAAALAVGGSPQSVIDGGRLFAVNFKNTPILWAGGGAEDEALAAKLKGAGMNLEFRTAANLSISAAVEWLAAHVRESFPDAIDCETSSPAFTRCYWTQLAKFDAGERNDVLPTTAIPPAVAGALDLGAFRYRVDDPGPGVLVSALPDKYDGPLKVGDRITALDGKPLENARQYERSMRQATQERTAVVMVERGKEHKRIETRVIVPRRPTVITARVQASYVPEEKEIRISTRTVSEMRVTVPPQWAPATLYWNGLSLEEIKAPGCLLLRIEKELLHSEKCP